MVERNPDLPCRSEFILRQGLQRRIRITMVHEVCDELGWSDVRELVVGRIRNTAECDDDENDMSVVSLGLFPGSFFFFFTFFIHPSSFLKCTSVYFVSMPTFLRLTSMNFVGLKVRIWSCRAIRGRFTGSRPPGTRRCTTRCCWTEWLHPRSTSTSPCRRTSSWKTVNSSPSSPKICASPSSAVTLELERAA